jgi:undecaprenyl-diphosphatase
VLRRTTVIVVLLGATLVGLARADALTLTNDTAAFAHEPSAPPVLIENELTAGKAVVLGLVEGITEYLPISSTGHLHVTQRLLDIGETDATKDAADTYAITIQAGAIFAVLVLYRRRIVDVARGLVGRSDAGRRVLIALVLAFLPAAAFGVAFDDAIKDNLLDVGPIAAAWFVGALAIWFVVPRVRRGDGVDLDAITTRQAAIIGAAQVLALWPGTSRSLVTIIVALAVGLSMAAAVEFSFLLGLVTLTAATVYDGAQNGSDLIDTFGIATPLLGLVVAFVSAVVAVRWMVDYLQRRDLRIFAIYRVGVAALALGLLASNSI